MKTIPWLVLLAFLFSGATAYALPPRQHRAEGVLASFDREKSVITLSPVSPGDPTTFVVKAGRTRLRHDGKKAAMEELSVGQAVHLYYKKELGEFVVTELSWKSPTLKEAHPKV